MVRYNKLDELRLIIRNNGTGMSSVNIGKIGWLLELILENKNNMCCGQAFL